MAKKSGKEKAEAGFDLGFSGLFRGLGDLVDLLSEMTEKGEEVLTRQGEVRLKGLGDKGRAVYGFSIRTGIGGMPKVERFGNVQSTKEGPVVADVREPLVDLFDEQEEIVLVAELPGVAEGEIVIGVQDDILSLETTGERGFAKEILLPSPVDVATLQRTYRNGILELRLKKIQQ